MSDSIIIGVIGGGHCSEDEARAAEEIGCLLAQQGAILVCGGLGGVMEAACRGARAAGGVTVGILPGDDGQTANPYVSIPIVTGIGYARNLIVVKSARAVIAVGGSYGTLSEIAHARQSGIPVIGLNTWQLARDNRQDDSIILARNAADAVDKAISLAAGKRGTISR